MPHQSDRSKPYWMRLREKIDADQAVRVLNAVTHNETVNGKEVTALQAQVSLKLVDKLLPSLQAVSVDIQNRQQLSKNDIQTLLLSKGVNPALMWQMMQAQPVDSVEKKAIESGESSTPPPPAEPGE